MDANSRLLTTQNVRFAGCLAAALILWGLLSRPVWTAEAERTVLRGPSWVPSAPPLQVRGRKVRVQNVRQLFQAVANARPGDTILLADGTYRMPRYLQIRTDRVTLRGESGDPRKVVLDGAASRHGELLGITGCSDVTIAYLTVQNVRWNGIKLNSNTGVQRVTIYNCILHNIWQRAIKGVAVPAERREELRPRQCCIRYCLFYNDRPKSYEDDPADRPDNFRGNYIGGIDVMFPTGWIISDNVFVGIHGRTGEARGAVFLWHDAQKCVVERNLIVDCDTGICLGNSHRPPGIRIHATGCVVRNNFVTRCPETGILADYTRDCLIAHNTIHDPHSRLRRLIRIVHENEGLRVVNNLLSGPPMRVETPSSVTIRSNWTGPLGELFVDVSRGDLHLKHRVDRVTDAGEPLDEVVEDFDRERRDDHPDIGADELVRGARTGASP